MMHVCFCEIEGPHCFVKFYVPFQGPRQVNKRLPDLRYVWDVSVHDCALSPRRNVLMFSFP